MYYALVVIAVVPTILNAMDWQAIANERIARVQHGEQPSILDEPITQQNNPTQNVTLLRLASQLNPDLMDRLLVAGANPNAQDSQGLPLESATTERTIKALIMHGARASLCKKRSPLATVFNHYAGKREFYRRGKKRTDSWLTELTELFTILIKNGADTSQYWNNDHPLKTILSSSALGNSEKTKLLNLMIDHACDPTLAASKNNDQLLYKLYETSDWYPIIKTSYEKAHDRNYRHYLYSRLRIFLIGWKKERDSAIRRLPPDMIKLIGTMVLEHEPIVAW